MEELRSKSFREYKGKRRAVQFDFRMNLLTISVGSNQHLLKKRNYFSFLPTANNSR